MVLHESHDVVVCHCHLILFKGSFEKCYSIRSIIWTVC